MLYFLVACVAFVAGILVGEYSERREARIREAKAKAAEIAEEADVELRARMLGLPRLPGESIGSLKARVELLSRSRQFLPREIDEMVERLPPDMRPAWWPPSPRQ